MIDRIVFHTTRIWRKLPRPLRSAWVTSWITFTSTLLMIGLGFLPLLANALTHSNFEPFFDSLELGLSAALAAATAFCAGILNGIYRTLRPIADAYKVNEPVEPPPHG